MRILRQRGYRRMPWRNGRGMTLEIARAPERGDFFSWRLSLASVAESCEFSEFRGYGRAVTLVSGSRLELTFAGHGRCVLHPGRRSVRFRGDWQTTCRVPAGPCTDLSLMVYGAARAGSRRARLESPAILSVDKRHRLIIPPRTWCALFLLSGGAMIEGPTGEPGSRPVRLRPLDTAVLVPGARRSVRLRSTASAAAQLVLLRWQP